MTLRSLAFVNILPICVPQSMDHKNKESRRRPMKGRRDFDEILLEAVDRGFQVPGEIMRIAMYDWLRTRCQIRREEIPQKLQTFHQALGYLLGTNAEVIEKLIAKDLYSRLGLNFEEHANWTLAEYVEYAKKHVKRRPVPSVSE